MRLSVIDLFAGAGGFGLGFAQADYDLLLSLEYDTWAVETLRYNSQHTIIHGDIQNYVDEKALLSLCPIKPRVIIGGPPCQGFSISGPAQKDLKDPRNALFKDFARWVEILEPDVFIMENVKGLLSRYNAKREKVIDIIQGTFANLGYQVTVWLLNAANYGVPQNRERIFIVGGKEKAIAPPPISHVFHMTEAKSQQLPLMGLCLQSTPTLWDAISDLPALEAGQGYEEQRYLTASKNTFQSWIRSEAPCLYNHLAMKHSKRLVERFKQIEWGQSVSDVALEYSPRQRGDSSQYSDKVYDQNNRRLHPDKPSHTITASFYANFVHPYQHRNLTAREGARIQTFPDSYRFMGKPTVVSQKLLAREGRSAEQHLCQYNQIGNAVPPLLAYHIAQHIRKDYFGC